MSTFTHETILLLDDQLELMAGHIQKLELAGYFVVPVSTLSDLHLAFQAYKIDFALLDVNLLPGEDIDRLKAGQLAVGATPYVEQEGQGFRIASWIRNNHPSTGIIMLTAERLASSDKIEALDLGADDYVSKVTEKNELVSRIVAVGRRISPKISSIVLGELKLVVENNLLQKESGEHIELTSSETRLIVALSKAPIKKKSRAELYELVFDAKIPTPNDRAIDNLVSKLRKKVKEKTKTEFPIETIYGGGYFLKI